MPLQATSGAASYDAFGGGVAAVPKYIEDVFSTWLIKPSADYTTYSINNGIDLSTNGGMTWFKARSSAGNNLVYDTARGSSSGSPNALITNNANPQQTVYFDYVTPNTNGFTVNFASGGGQLTNSGINYTSWTFRKQQKFLDVLTYTGTGSARTITHNLGSVPGFIIVKRTDTTSNWRVYHRYADPLASMILNLTNAVDYPNSTIWNGTAPTNTVFSVGTSNDTNASGGTYVAYLFAHNAGGFGLTGTDNVVSCGAFTTDGSGKATVNLGWEPQWVLFKNFSSSDDWVILDNMRGFNRAQSNLLWPNLNSAEVDAGINVATPTATGFETLGGQYSPSQTIIYIAIRRGPMKVPTVGTSVFKPILRTGTSADATVTGVGFAPDLFVSGVRTGGGGDQGGFGDRLRGIGRPLRSWSTAAERNDGATDVTAYGIDGISVGPDQNVGYMNYSPGTYIWYFFKRAPSFMDQVCYTGDNAFNRNITHNLSVKPDLVIVKCRSTAGTNWVVGVGESDAYLHFNSDAASPQFSGGYVENVYSTSTTFHVDGGSLDNVNTTGRTYVAYLFATLAGVSKVGSYTGTATTKQIDCGFTGGARLVLIKRTDSTGNWYVWDSARGIVSGNDPYWRFDSVALEVTNTDYIDTYSAGFEISSTAPSAINASGGTFIFLAIA